MISDWQKSLALRILRTGATCSEVADEVGMWPAAVADLARKYMIPVRPRGRAKGSTNLSARKPEEIRRRAVEMVKDGATLRAVGAELGVSHEVVNQWSRADGVTTWHSRAAWSVRKRQAKALFRRGASDEDVAVELGVHIATARGWRKATEADKPVARRIAGRPRKRPITLAPTITQTKTTEALATETKTEAQCDVDWLREDMERRWERARIESEAL